MSNDKDLKVLKKVVVREEFVALTGDFREAIILGQFIYWSQRTSDFDKYIAEENARIEKFLNEEDQQEKLEPTNGWIYKTATELGEECMLITKTKGKSGQIGDNTILGYIDNLIKNGWIEKRNNPKYKWDKTMQYRVNLIKVFGDLLDIGYLLQDYKVGTQLYQQLQKTKMQTSKNENADSKNENQDAKNEIQDSKIENQDSKNENQDAKNEIQSSENEEQYHRLPTDTTSDTTSENTSDITSDREGTSPSLSVSDTWEGVKKLLVASGDLNELAIGTWINPLKPVEIKDGVMHLVAEQPLHKQFADAKFKSVIDKALKELELNGFEVTLGKVG